MATVEISDAEKVYVLHGIQDNVRVDGRGRKDVRPIVLESGLVSLKPVLVLDFYCLLI